MDPASPQIEVRRSARRRRTVSAYRDGDRIVILMPARISKREEAKLIEEMVRKVEAQSTRRTSSDSELMQRAERLSRRHLGGLARPASVRWVSNQRTRWGSCTPANGTIRLSHRLQGMPGYVSDYVLLHELAHLLQPDHGRSFWALLESYPQLERARAYLDGAAFGAGLPPVEDASDDEPADVEGPAERD